MNNQSNIVALSDTHGFLPELPPCDIVCIAGDISPLYIQRYHDEVRDWLDTDFRRWVEELECKKVMLVAGNHDFAMQSDKTRKLLDNMWKVCYLEDQWIEIDGKTIYGSPWVAGPPGWAFFDPSFQKVQDTLPKNMDLAIFHQPLCYGENGKVHQDLGWGLQDFGSQTLEDIVRDRKPKKIITGHVHSGNHDWVDMDGIQLINVSMLDENYMGSYPYVNFVI